MIETIWSSLWLYGQFLFLPQILSVSKCLPPVTTTKMLLVGITVSCMKWLGRQIYDHHSSSLYLNTPEVIYHALVLLQPDIKHTHQHIHHIVYVHMSCHSNRSNTDTWAKQEKRQRQEYGKSVWSLTWEHLYFLPSSKQWPWQHLKGK